VGRKDFASFEEVLTSVAERKAAAAKAHLAGANPAAEKPLMYMTAPVRR
jgi:hypothetical protein